MQCSASDANAPMKIMDHIRDFRKMIIHIIIALIITSLVLVPFATDIFNYISKPLLDTLPNDKQLLSIAVISPVFVPLKVVFFLAFCITLPFNVYQIWKFVAPGLYKNEKKIIIPLVASVMVMFALGITYCFYFVFNFVFKFISTFTPHTISFAPDIDSYISFVLHMFLAFGFTFEVPVAVVLLCSLKILTLEKAKKIRRYVIVLAFGIAAVITPPDIASQLLLALPIIVLYELGIICSRLFVKVK